MLSAEKIYRVFIDSLFPRKCPVCGEIVAQRGYLICRDCLDGLDFVKEPVCAKCGKPVISRSQELCWDCSQHPRSFDAGRALLVYEGAARHAMAQIKYHNRRDLVEPFARLLALRCGDWIRETGAQCLAPVPVHPDRLKRRGYNQAAVLARQLGILTGLPVREELLERVRQTQAQKELGARDRLRNLSGAFRAGEVPEGLSRVMLVDDIYTTGSTAEACAQALQAAGIGTVFVLSVCIGSDI